MNMAQPRKLPKAPRELLDDDFTPGELPPEDSPADVAFFEKRDDMIAAGGEGTIRVYREGPGGHRDLTFVRGFSLTEFEPEMLQAPPFAGGRFRIHMRSNTGLVSNFLFKVESLPGAKPLDPITLQPVQANDTATILAAIKDGFAAIAAAMHPPKQGMGVEETIKLIGAINSMNPRESAPPRNGDDGTIERFSKFVEVIEDIRGPVGADGEVSMLKLVARALDKIAEPLGDVLANVAQKRLAKNPAAAAALGEVVAAAVHENAGAEIPETEGAEPMDFSTQLKMFLPMIIAQAAADNDPGTYADMLYDNVPLPEIRKWIARPDWFAVLQSLDPRVAPYEKWFTELHDLIVEGLTPEAIEGTKGGTATSGPVDATPSGAKPSPKP
jgi:hypothetical protein